MFSLRILSGLVSAYLVAAPCLLIDHSSPVAGATGIPIAQAYDDHEHGHDAGDKEGQEHCCEDLSGSIHAPLKHLPASVAVIAVVPSIEIQIPYVHLDRSIALSRDGPLHERAREFAKTIVIRS